MSLQCGQNVLHVAPVWTERSTCRLYPKSKIDFFLRAYGSYACSTFGYMYTESSTCSALRVDSVNSALQNDGPTTRGSKANLPSITIADNSIGEAARAL